MANAQTSFAKIEDSIECSVCSHRFREPKWLNCFHTFCLQCLQEICKNQGPQCKKLPCPLCRQETILTNGNVSDLLDNSEMKALVETITQQESVAKQKFEQLHDFPELVAKCRRSKTEFELSAKNLDNLIMKLYKVFCDTKEKISKKATWEVSRIRDEEQELIKEAEDIHTSKVEFLKSLQASDRREATQTAYKLDEVNRLMSGGSNGNKGQDFKKRICKDLEKATMKHPQSVPDGLTFMDFKENNQGSLGELVQNDDDMTLKIRHPTPGPVPSSGIPTGASPSPSSSPGVVNTQGLATGTAHDMSNKGAPSRPGLAPSPHQQGNVVQQQQPPQGMILPSPYLIQQQREGQPPPNFGQGVPGRRSSKEPKKVIQRASQPPKLSTAGDKAWKPDKDVPDDVEEAKTFELMKKMKSLLNKLTPNNFSKLKDQALSYSIDTEERLKGVIDVVFEKAISEQAFSRTYAQLCRDLSQLRVPTASGQGVVQFRTLLINRCQKEFEEEKNDEKEEEVAREAIAKLPVDQRSVAMEDLELKLIKKKRRSLGNIRFIGELFKLQMLIEQIMHDCIFKLLCSKDEESLECMSNLMSTIGKILDHEKAKNRIDQYFTIIKSIIGQKKTSARIRFMLQDVVDLRQHRNWVPRRDTDNPKTLEQIYQDYKRDEERKKMEGLQAQMAPPPQRMSRNKRDQPQRVGPPPPEGWSTVTSTKATRVAVDPNKFKVMKQQSIDDDIQLGPGPRSFGGWSRGSSGGSSKTQSESQEPKQSNRFMMLSDDRKGRVPDSKGHSPQSLQGKQEPAPVSAPVKEVPRASVPPAISEDVFKKKAMAMIEEYFYFKDIEEALTCVSELNSPSHMHILVRSAMNCSLEKNPGTRDSAGLLFHKLIKAGHLSKEKFIAGVKEVLEYADDMALDVPMIWKYLGEIIGATFRDNSLSIKVLADMMEPVKAARKAGDLMAEILLTAVKLTSADVVGEMWQSSGFTWDMFLPSGKNVQEFVNNKKLGFTLSTGVSTTTNSGGDANANDLSDEEFESLIKRELGSILATSDNVNDKVFDWIQKNLNISSPEKQRLFIRALVTVVVQSTIQGDKGESCRMNHDLLNVRTAILKRYINNDNNLELQALYAVQALNQHLESPPRLLGLIFNVLYDEDVIPEETFYAWQKSSDPNESVGKGVALKSVTSFFDWLHEAEEEPAK